MKKTKEELRKEAAMNQQIRRLKKKIKQQQGFVHPDYPNWTPRTDIAADMP